MNDREALKLALEALNHYEKAGLATIKTIDAIAAIKEVLAQPEQEPVAWTDGPHLVMRTDWRDRANYKGPWVDIGRAIPDSWVPVLYTTPPQRKPLTRERLVAMADVPQGVQTFDDWVELFGREIEAAHDIKGDA